MPGWRVGFVVGNKDIIKYLEKFKSFVDYGVATFIQLACTLALKEGKNYIENIKVSDAVKSIMRCAVNFSKDIRESEAIMDFAIQAVKTIPCAAMRFSKENFGFADLV